MAASDITMPEGTSLSSIIANLNVFASDPSTSKGAGEIIYQSGAGVLKVNTQTTNPTTNPTWTTVGAGGGVTDHAALTGLAGDDHTQYLLINGTRGMTGALNLNMNTIDNVSMIDGATTSDLYLRAMNTGGKISLQSGSTPYVVLNGYNGDIDCFKPLDMNGNNIDNIGTLIGTGTGDKIEIGGRLDINGQYVEGVNHIFGRNTTNLAYNSTVVVTYSTAGVSKDILLMNDNGVEVGNDLWMATHKIVNLGAPTVDTDAATKKYVDDHGGGGGSLSNIVEDTTPQLGGDLDCNTKKIKGVTEIQTTTSILFTKV